MFSLKASISSHLQYLVHNLPPLPSNNMVWPHLLLLQAVDHMVLETGRGGECHPTMEGADMGHALVWAVQVSAVLQVGAEPGATV